MRKRVICLLACLAVWFSCLGIGVSSVLAVASHEVLFQSELGGFSPVTQTVADGALVSAPESIRRSGYTVSWVHGEVAYDFAVPVTTDLTLQAVWSKVESPYVDADQAPIQFDVNGVSKQKMRLNGTDVANYGIFEPNTQYRVDADGSVLVLAASYTALGGELDVTKTIEIAFLMDPDKVWSTVSGVGRFLINLYDSYQQLFEVGAEGWNPTNGASMIAWGSLSNADGYPYHRITAGDGYTEVYDYTQHEAILTIDIAKNKADSCISLNGTKFANLSISQSDFIDGKATCSMTAFDAALQAKIRVRNIDMVPVSYRSTVPGFVEINRKVRLGASAENLIPQEIPGYTFDGWYKDENGLIAFDFDQRIEASTVVYAKYTDNSKEYVTVTFCSRKGNFEPVLTRTEKGRAIAEAKDLFVREGFTVVWMNEANEVYDFQVAVNADLTLIAKWVETELLLYHKMNDVVDESYRYEYLQDENGWDEEYTTFSLKDTFVDANGNEVISSFYGGTQHDTSFITQDTSTIFVLMGIGSITNLKKLDVSKEIVIDVAMNNWDFASSAFNCGDVTFSLYDNLARALRSTNPSDDPHALAMVKTSVYPGTELFGKFKDVGSKVVSSDLGFEQDKKFRIQISISKEGTQNVLKVNDEVISGALAGIKQSDFLGGYAYLHVRNYGCTTRYECLVSQTSALTIAPVQNGTVTMDVAKDGIALFKQKVTLSCTPAEGYKVKSATIGNKIIYATEENTIIFYKGWADEMVSVEFAKELVLTFDTKGGNPVNSQSIFEGELFYKPSNPKRAGYIFQGWFADEGGTVAFDFTKTAQTNVTAYAKWTQEKQANKGCGDNTKGAILFGLLMLGASVICKVHQ